MARIKFRKNFAKRKFKKFKRGKVSKKVKTYVKKTVSKMTPTTTINYSDRRIYSNQDGTVQSTGFTVNNLLTQGEVDYGINTDVSGRIGSRVRMSKFKIRSWIWWPAPATDTPNVVAYMLVLYKNPHGFGQTLTSTANNVPVNAFTYMTSSETTLPARFLAQLTTGFPSSLMTAQVDDRYADVIWEKRGILMLSYNQTTGNNKQHRYGGSKKLPKYMTFNVPNTVSLQSGNIFFSVIFLGKTVETMDSDIEITSRFFLQFKSVSQHQDMQ